ncbi:hypothetical protein AnaeK_3582 [Anaeromyxobacter sp. K]|nr:hypothetical protein AnaeK_3582 [Anaeromyxobacter sp. K]
MLRASMIAGCVIVSLACGSSGDSLHDRCLAITAAYEAALPAALACDPSAPDPCTVGRPSVMALQDADGVIHPEALCLAPCYHSVNSRNVSGLDALLAEYDSAGCAYAACWCQPLPVRCDASGTCYGLIPP